MHTKCRQVGRSPPLQSEVHCAPRHHIQWTHHVDASEAGSYSRLTDFCILVGGLVTCDDPHATAPISAEGSVSARPKPKPVSVTRRPPPTGPVDTDTDVTTGGSYSKATAPNVAATGALFAAYVTGRCDPTPGGATHVTFDCEPHVVWRQARCPPPHRPTAADPSSRPNFDP